MTLTLKNPESLAQLVDGLTLSAKKKWDLNRRMANHARAFFRAQIRHQRDVADKTYTKRRNPKYQYEGKKAPRTNRNMLMGLSRSLRTQVSNDGFAVGLTGIAGRIGRVHNDGEMVNFTTRIKGFYNSKTQKWEGGIKHRQQYQMPKRTYLGFTPRLEKELLQMAMDTIKGKNQ